MLDTIRQLSADFKMESLALKYYIPEESLTQLEKRAKWNESENMWIIDNLDRAGNSVRRPHSAANKSEDNAKTVELRNPYLAYSNNPDGDGYVHATDEQKRSKKAKSKSSKSKTRSKRPATASRRR